jgi:hypothetical protein
MTQLQYTDLAIRCDACNGAGYVYNPDWRDVSMLKWTDTEVHMFVLEHGYEELPCGECDGTGERLTETGEVLYRLVQPLISRAIKAHERRYHSSTP